jgi:isoleucyl-tRNA synthetase
VLDQQGRKMSKSVGNVISPEEITTTLGADILRLWCLNSDYSEDVRIGSEVLKHQQDLYRRFRNTLRYLLGVTHDFEQSSFGAYSDEHYEQFPELEKYILKKLYDLGELLLKSIEIYDFQMFCVALQTFCSNDLSAFYFDIRKDTVYCDEMTSQKRRACITVMGEIFMCLSHWLAPILSFTAEEAWGMSALNKHKTSIHTELYPKISKKWNNESVQTKWGFVQQVRKRITEALEIEREAKAIGSSLEAEVTLYVNQRSAYDCLTSIDMAEVAIVSLVDVELCEKVPAESIYDDDLNVGITVRRATGTKCSRCWKIDKKTTLCDTEQYGKIELCPRCVSVISSQTIKIGNE